MSERVGDEGGLIRARIVDGGCVVAYRIGDFDGAPGDVLCGDGGVVPGVGIGQDKPVLGVAACMSDNDACMVFFGNGESVNFRYFCYGVGSWMKRFFQTFGRCAVFRPCGGFVAAGIGNDSFFASRELVNVTSSHCDVAIDSPSGV